MAILVVVRGFEHGVIPMVGQGDRSRAKPDQNSQAKNHLAPMGPETINSHNSACRFAPASYLWNVRLTAPCATSNRQLLRAMIPRHLSDVKDWQTANASAGSMEMAARS
ncbi:MAG: hypothetical protein ACRDWD_06950 [Acidimicrobiia bacterium]